MRIVDKDKTAQKSASIHNEVRKSGSLCNFLYSPQILLLNYVNPRNRIPASAVRLAGPPPCLDSVQPSTQASGSGLIQGHFFTVINHQE
jgi:hypothetical protein